ncbi:hypothetical protein SLS60_002891 [Paraconiothyrium brasiliense]|uniref:Uncharacterized protein n=1 Tax=Paraconiothyrium brasiliense TaxID=300254 RepID=A0ABR3RU35_9PLEO
MSCFSSKPSWNAGSHPTPLRAAWNTGKASTTAKKAGRVRVTPLLGYDYGKTQRYSNGRDFIVDLYDPVTAVGGAYGRSRQPTAMKHMEVIVGVATTWELLEVRIMVVTVEAAMEGVAAEKFYKNLTKYGRLLKAEEFIFQVKYFESIRNVEDVHM